MRAYHTQTTGGNENELLFQLAKAFLADVAGGIVISIQLKPAVRTDKHGTDRDFAYLAAAGRTDLRAGVIAIHLNKTLPLCVQHLFQPLIKRSWCIVAQLAG